jgi:hypothetical protein|tara:strand:- start:6221 stop:6457 length:237 start_codon:yes stop_codon:yes gene_type:complete
MTATNYCHRCDALHDENISLQEKLKKFGDTPILELRSKIEEQAKDIEWLTNKIVEHDGASEEESRAWIKTELEKNSET